MDDKPLVPLALRRLRHVEYFSLISRGNFAAGDQQHQASQHPATTALSYNLNSPSTSGALIATNLSQHSKISFHHFFPDEKSCCRLEILVPPSSEKNKTTKGGRRLLYRSEPVAPTRHPCFAPLAADVRNIVGANIDSVIIRVVAETLTATLDEEVDLNEIVLNRQQQSLLSLGGNNTTNANDVTSTSTSCSSSVFLHQNSTRNQSLGTASAAADYETKTHNNVEKNTNTKFSIKNQQQKRTTTTTHQAKVFQVGGGEEKEEEQNEEEENGKNKFGSEMNYLMSNDSNNSNTNDTNYNFSRDSNNNFFLYEENLEKIRDRKIMSEISVQFSKLEFLAEHLSDATELLRDRYAGSNSNNNNTENNNNNSSSGKDSNDDCMECLIVCSDGVFVVPSSSSSEKEKETTAATTSAEEGDGEENENSLSLLKKLGNENYRLRLQQQQQKGASGSSSSGVVVGADAWDVVASTQEPDRVSMSTIKNSITTTLTLHFAQQVLKQRVLLDKQRLVNDMQSQLEQHDEQHDVGEKHKVAEEESQKQKEQQQQQENNNNSSSSTKKSSSSSSSSIRRQLTKNYRQVELDDIRRQVEQLRGHLQQQQALREMLQEQLKTKKSSLQSRKEELNQRSQSILALKEACTQDTDYASQLEKQLRLYRNKVLSGMQRIFPLSVAAPHSICGFNIPDNEPQNEQHACALGCIVHAVSTFCQVHGHAPLHPLMSQTSRSCVAEYVGAPPNKIFPLYSTNATEREQSTRAVLLLRRVMAHAAFAIHNQRQASDLPFAIALQKLLFNR